MDQRPREGNQTNMTCHTICFFFKVDPEIITDNSFDSDLREIGKICLGDVKSKQDVDVGSGDRVIVMVGSNTSHLTMRVYTTQGTVTVDTNFMVTGDYKDNYEALVKMKKQYAFSDDEYRWDFFIYHQFEKRIRKYLGSKCQTIESVCVPLRRGDVITKYFASADDRIREHDYDRLVHRSFSSYQKVEVYHSPSLGNTLHLDGDIMFSEKDDEFNEMLLGLGRYKRNDYKGRDILLLGGGCGCSLNLLLKHEPNMVIMCEIDREVVEVCKRYFRSCCGDSLDKLEGPHHKTIIDDGFQILRNAIKNGEKYDYVVDDISMDPAEDENDNADSMDMQQSNSLLISLSKQVMKPGAKYICAMDPEPVSERENLKKVVHELGGQVSERVLQCVPSFLDRYFFFEVTYPMENSTKGEV